MKNVTTKELLSLLKSESGKTYRVAETIALRSGMTLSANGATIIADGGIEICGDNVSLYNCKIICKNGIVSEYNDFTIQNCEIEGNIISKGKRFIAKNNKILGDVTLDDGSVNSLVAQNEFDGSVFVRGGFNCVVILNTVKLVKAEKNANIYVIKNNVSGCIELCDNRYLICDGNKADKTVNEQNEEYNGDNLRDVNARPDFGADESLLPHTDRDLFIGMERQTSVTDLSKPEKLGFNEYLQQEAAARDVVIIPPGAYLVPERCVLGAQQSNTDIYAYGAYLEADFAWTQALMVQCCENLNISGLTVGHTVPACGMAHIVETDVHRDDLENMHKITFQIRLITAAGFGDGFGHTDPDVFTTQFFSFYHQDDRFRPYSWYGQVIDIKDNGDGTMTMGLSGNASEYIKKGDLVVCRLARRGFDTVHTAKSSNVKYKDLTVYSVANAAACRVSNLSRGVSFERYHGEAHSGYEINKATYERFLALGEKWGIDFEVYYDSVKEIYRGPDAIWGGTGAMEVMDTYDGATLICSKLERFTDDGSNQRGTSSRVAGLVYNKEDDTYTVFYKGNHNGVYHGHYSSLSGDTYEVGRCSAIEKGDIILAYTSDGKVLISHAPALTNPVAGGIIEGQCMGHPNENENDACPICGKATHVGEHYPTYGAEYDPESGVLTFKTRRNPSFIKYGDLLTFKTNVYSVKVDAKYVHPEVAEGYDLASNSYVLSERIALDNVGKNCANFTFDNVLMDSIKSRGILIKAAGITVKNCTFRDLTLQALVLGPESEWGESSLPSNITIRNCIFDNCAGSTKYQKQYNISYDAFPNITPIDIRGTGGFSNDHLSKVEPVSGMVTSDIVIEHNKFINAKTEHLICATGASEIVIKDNTFEECKAHEKDGVTGKIMYVNGCYDINMSGNTYSDRVNEMFAQGNARDEAFTLYNCKHIKIDNIDEIEEITAKP